MKKNMTCKICKTPISELGAYAKVAVSWFEHLSCHDNMQIDFARNQGRNEVLIEQSAAARELEEKQARERLDREARERAEAERRQEVAERERTNRIIAQQANPLPPKLEPAKKPEAKPEEKHDRFELLEIE